MKISYDSLAVTFSLIVTVVALFITIWIGLKPIKLKFPGIEVEFGKHSDEPEATVEKITQLKKESHLQLRINEVSKAIHRYDSNSQANKWSNGLLIAGQYVVGGTLASSFLQQSLSIQVVGILGLVVLVATIVHQRYRPDFKSRIAQGKSKLLRSALRLTQDELATSENPDYTKLIDRLTRALNNVDKVDEEPDEGTASSEGDKL